MNKLSSRILIILLTFVIGISCVAGWLYYQESQKTQIILPNSRWESIFFDGVENYTFGSINRITKIGGLVELRKTIVKKGDTEVRIWRGFGLDPLEAVILKCENGQWSAMHLKGTDIDKIEVKNLNPPKSGWELFWQQLISKEILTLRDSSEINCGEGGIDGISYVVEINQDKIYRTYMLSPSYSHGKCQEANQIDDIGDFIGEEFDSVDQKCKRDEWFACAKLRKSYKQINK